MKKGGLVHGAWQDLRGAPRRSLVSMLGIAMGVAILLVIVGLGLGARNAVLKKIVQELPVDHIEVVPANIDLGIIQVDTSALFGGSGFGPGAVEQLKEIQGVEAVYPKLEVKLPLGARGGGRFFGRALYTDLFMTGVPPELLKAEVPAGFEDSGEEIPVVISEQLIEIYNGSVASAIGTPRITRETLKGFEFDIVVGRSLMLGERGVKKKGVERGRIVGVSRFGIKLGATVPISVARRLMASYGTARPETYSSMIVKASEPALVPAIIEAIEAQGFRVDKQAARTRDILMTLILFGGSLGLLILALAGLNITHSFFAQLSERKREFAVMRAVGAKKRHIVGLVLWQATLLGILGGLVGAVAAHGIAWGLDGLALRWLPDFPFRPDSFFELPLWGDGLALVAAVMAAVLGALWPALRAGRASIVRLFAEL
jgi:ABC-type lipoprotein release transport system permease subunit